MHRPGGNPRKNTSSPTSLTQTTLPTGNLNPLRYNAHQYVFQLEQSELLVAPVPAPSAYAALTSKVARKNGGGVENDPCDAAA